MAQAFMGEIISVLSTYRNLPLFEFFSLKRLCFVQLFRELR